MDYEEYLRAALRATAPVARAAPRRHRGEAGCASADRPVIRNPCSLSPSMRDKVSTSGQKPHRDELATTTAADPPERGDLKPAACTPTGTAAGSARTTRPSRPRAAPATGGCSSRSSPG